VTEVEAVGRDLTNAGLKPLAVVAEDPVLAAPSVGELQAALGAELLYDGDNAAAAVESVLVAPIYTDGARVHFRRFASTAVLTPFYKTDLLLAAIDSGAACVVVTGGRQPSHYVIDRARHGETTLMLAEHSTVPTVAGLSEVWTRSPFSGAAKTEAAWSRLSAQLDLATLQSKLK
jgi:BioD-like phosphotransacetylase family protein